MSAIKSGPSSMAIVSPHSQIEFHRADSDPLRNPRPNSNSSFTQPLPACIPIPFPQGASTSLPYKHAPRNISQPFVAPSIPTTIKRSPTPPLCRIQRFPLPIHMQQIKIPSRIVPIQSILFNIPSRLYLLSPPLLTS